MFNNKFKYLKGGLYNIVFTANKGKPISVMNVYYAEPPFSINWIWSLPQFILMAIGETLFGVLGCHFFVEQTPQKFKYHTMLDWYWSLGWSNAIILIVIHSGFFITFFFQIYWLSITVLVAFIIFFYFTFRFPFIHLRPGQKLPSPGEPSQTAEPRTGAEITQPEFDIALPAVDVIVASDAPPPTLPPTEEPVSEVIEAPLPPDA